MRTSCTLEVMSPHPPECFKTDRASVVRIEPDGKFLIQVKGFRIHPETKEKSRGTARFAAWRRPDGGENDFVCGSLAPGEPSSAHPNAGNLGGLVNRGVSQERAKP